jgi:hypothetical protein
MGPGNGLGDDERRKILPLPGLEFQALGRPARSHFSIPTALSRLQNVKVNAKFSLRSFNSFGQINHANQWT